MNELIIRITGTAGQGVISAGDIFSLSTARSGRYVTTYRSFPSEIRGEGQCVFQFRMSEKKTLTPSDYSDILIAFNEESVKQNINQLKTGGILIVDSDTVKNEFDDFSEIIKYYIPFSTISKEKADPKSKNMVALGFLAGLLSQLNMIDQLKEDIKRRYAAKSQEIIEANIKALEAGFDYVQTQLKRVDNLTSIQMATSGQKLIMSGNEAIAFASIVAGCRFYSGYPITPATEIMEWLAREMPKVGGNVIQCEDEIAAVTAAIGASYGGAKALTAT
ncbi:MAG: 2-oxoacid:acceptor oxidoreductase family protein, partial [Candidatus Gastranaerophilales bacterium]|nr:2-oxoacid:acceptor oxidoreductase family protein [Candidatus Gastranaerophilales bacterium]